MFWKEIEVVKKVILERGRLLYQHIKDRYSHSIETSQLSCNVSQSTGFKMIIALTLNGINILNYGVFQMLSKKSSACKNVKEQLQQLVS